MKMATWFKVRKAAHVAAFFAKAEGGSINVLKLVKLIYLADRLFMQKYDTPMLNDLLVSMPHGPVNSMTLSYIDGLEEDREDWDAFIADRAQHNVGLARQDLRLSDLDELSEADLEVLDEVWTALGKMTPFQLRDHTHAQCPEWENPRGSSNPIPYERVFKYLNKESSADLAERVAASRTLDRIFADA